MIEIAVEFETQHGEKKVAVWEFRTLKAADKKVFECLWLHDHVYFRHSHESSWFYRVNFGSSRSDTKRQYRKLMGVGFVLDRIDWTMTKVVV